MAEVQVRCENAGLAVELQRRVFHVDVVDPILEFADEDDGIHLLPVQVAGVEIEAESLAMADCLQGPVCGIDVEGDLGGMHLQAESDANFVEDVQDRVEHLGEVGKTLVDGLIGHRWEAVQHVPDRRTREAIGDFEAEVARRPRCVLHRLDGPLALALRIAGQFGRSEDIGARVVVGVAHELASQVV